MAVSATAPGEVFVAVDEQGWLGRTPGGDKVHPPTLMVYQDDDGEGVAGRHTTLVTGLTTDMITTRCGEASAQVDPNAAFLVRISPQGLKPVSFSALKDSQENA